MTLTRTFTGLEPRTNSTMTRHGETKSSSASARWNPAFQAGVASARLASTVMSTDDAEVAGGAGGGGVGGGDGDGDGGGGDGDGGGGDGGSEGGADGGGVAGGGDGGDDGGVGGGGDGDRHAWSHDIAPQSDTHSNACRYAS